MRTCWQVWVRGQGSERDTFTLSQLQEHEPAAELTDSGLSAPTDGE